MKKEIEELSLTNTKKHIKERGVYYTPTKLIEFMYDIAKRYGKGNPKNVYDPTIGTGALLTPFEDDVPKYGQEINGEQLEIAKRRLKNFNYYVGDTLQDPAFKYIEFDLIMSNYPFSMKWEPKEDWRFLELPVLPPKSKADYAFIVHCLKYLAEDGVAVVMGFPGITYRGNAEGKIRKWLVEQNYISEVIQVPRKDV